MEPLLLFFAAALLLALAPGPDNLYVLTQAALQGRRAGLAVTLGLCTGLLGHTLLVALGGAALLQNSPLAFTALRWLGAGYLLWLAWQAFNAQPLASTSGREQRSLGALYRRGILMNLSNPKVALFFLALLPQFTQPQLGQVFWQLLGLGGVFMLAALLVFSLISVLADRLAQRLRQSEAWQFGLTRASAMLFVGLALKLAIVS